MDGVKEQIVLCWILKIFMKIFPTMMNIILEASLGPISTKKLLNKFWQDHLLLHLLLNLFPLWRDAGSRLDFF